MTDKKLNIYLILGLFFASVTVTAESIGPKIVDVHQFIPFLKYLPFFNNRPLNISAGVLLWPMVFICTDIVSHYFGKKGVMRISYITAALLIFVFTMYYWASSMPPAQFWVDINAKNSNFNINTAYSLIFMQSTKIIFGSLVAFVSSQIIDATIYHQLRIITNEKLLWMRALVSTFFSQLIDSYCVITIAFYFMGDWTLNQIAEVGTSQFVLKLLIAILLTPLLYLVHFFIDLYLGDEKN